mgnify:CR=1 FL=1
MQNNLVNKTFTTKRKKLLLPVLALVLYIFNITPVGFPDKIGTREYLSLLVFFPYFCKYINRSSVYKTIIIANYSQILISIISIVINQTTDFWYVQFAIRNILYINGALLCVSLLPKRSSIDLLMFLVCVAIVINNLIAALGFFDSGIMEAITSFQNLGDEGRIANTVAFGNRMLGLGKGNYFMGGVISGFAIILLFYLYVRKKITGFFAYPLILFVFITGTYIARTTIVGLGIGLFFFVKNVRISKIITLFFSDGESKSLNHMLSMYERTFDLKTFFLGDGLSKQDGAYYMETDIGYLRNIFYFGIIGTIFGYFYYETKIINLLHKTKIISKRFAFLLFSYLIILNFKGVPDYNFLLFIFLAYYIRNEKVIRNETASCHFIS